MSDFNIYVTGLQLPQMLKCAWDGRTPSVIQIPYPEGDSFEMRVQERARLAKLQKLRPESKAALLHLFGDEFDLGKHTAVHLCLHACERGIPAAAVSADWHARKLL